MFKYSYRENAIDQYIIFVCVFIIIYDSVFHGSLYTTTQYNNAHIIYYVRLLIFKREKEREGERKKNNRYRNFGHE